MPKFTSKITEKHVTKDLPSGDRAVFVVEATYVYDMEAPDVPGEMYCEVYFYIEPNKVSWAEGVPYGDTLGRDGAYPLAWAYGQLKALLEYPFPEATRYLTIQPAQESWKKLADKLLLPLGFTVSGTAFYQLTIPPTTK